MIDTDLLIEARQHLEKRGAALSSALIGPVVERMFAFSEIRAGDRNGELSKWTKEAMGDYAGSPIIYRISVRDLEMARHLCVAFDAFKLTRSHKLPRKNAFAESQTLYVGSSVKTRGRIREHLFGAARGTYSLNLAHWLPDIEGELKVEICGFGEPVNATLVQDIEDALWRSSRPMYGRSGPS